MALYAADTHVIAWYWAGSPRLSQTARTILDEALLLQHEVIISPLVLAELVIMAEKQRVSFDLTAIIATLSESPGFRLVVLSTQIALRTQELTTLPDIHDRLIVATALVYDATLITADQTISQSNYVPVVW
jgi:PIN domain nuclease of toxin-antitoxin system